MNLQQAAAVLAKAQAYDRRTIGEADVLAWHEALSDVDPADALEAVTRHYREDTAWIMPAHVRRHAATIDHDRRRTQREAAEAAEARELAAIAARPVTDRGRQAIAAIRAMLPPGNPDKLRRPEWLAHERRTARASRADAKPNPHYNSTRPPPSEVETES